MPSALFVAITPALGILFEVTVGAREDQCDDRKLNHDLVENCRNDISSRHGVSAEKKRNRDDEGDDEADAEIEFQHANIEREDHRPDQLGAESDAALVLAVAASDDHRVAVLLQDRFDFRVGERTIELGLFVFDLRVQIFGKLLHDVVALRFGKCTAYGVEIFFEDWRSHGHPTWRRFGMR